MYTQRPLTGENEVIVDSAGRPVSVGPAVVAEPAFPPPERTAVVVPPETRQVAVATETHRRYAFDSFVVGIVGLALLIVGLIALTRAGTSGPMDQPVVKVVGFTHTATLGLIEIGMGVLLLIAAAATSRGAAIFFGLVLGVGAVVGAVQTHSFKRSLALESGFAWITVVAAAVVVLASIMVPRVHTASTRVETH